MKLPLIQGVIDRRMLINYRVDPQWLARMLPAPFRPKLHRGHGVVGICLIRLKSMRPRWCPSWLGFQSENAAHRFAVEWDEPGCVREGVYVRRRDTDSRFNALAGGRLFPGIQSHSQFTVRESATELAVNVDSDDGQVHLSVVGAVASRLPADSIFQTLAEASDFLERGSRGYSATPDPTRFQGMELKCTRWHVEPLAIEAVRSSLFDDPALFPPGSIKFDCGILMRGIEHQWHGMSDLCCTQ